MQVSVSLWPLGADYLTHTLRLRCLLLQIVFLGKCPGGHSTAETKGSVRSSAVCDICYMPMKERSPGDVLMQHCKACDFDVCSVCATSGAVAVTKGSYVTVSPKYKGIADAAEGPLQPGRFGQVVKTDDSDVPFKVRRGEVTPGSISSICVCSC